MDQEQGQLPLEGYLKWYNPVKGFGFVVEESSNQDILLHANVLKKCGRNSITEGALVDFKVQKPRVVYRSLKFYLLIQVPYQDQN